MKFQWVNTMYADKSKAIKSKAFGISCSKLYHFFHIYLCGEHSKSLLPAILKCPVKYCQPYLLSCDTEHYKLFLLPGCSRAHHPSLLHLPSPNPSFPPVALILSLLRISVLGSHTDKRIYGICISVLGLIHLP